jgi:hypothetical protein
MEFENCKTDFVSFALATDDVLVWNLEIIEIERTCRRCSDAQFLLLFSDLNTHVFGCYEASDAFVSLAWVYLFIPGQQKRCAPSGEHTLAKIRKTSASYELVIHILDPLMIQ